MGANGWVEWKEYVLAELKRIDMAHEKINDKLDQLRLDIIMLKFKSSIWGLVGASIPIAIAIVIQLIIK